MRKGMIRERVIVGPTVLSLVLLLTISSVGIDPAIYSLSVADPVSETPSLETMTPSSPDNESIVITAGGIAFVRPVFTMDNITLLCPSTYEMLMQNESFVEELEAIKSMGIIGGYKYNPILMNNTVNNSAERYYLVRSLIFMNQTHFVQLVLCLVETVHSDRNVSYSLYDFKTIKITEENSTQIATHIDILEAFIEEAPKFNISLQESISNDFILPLLVGDFYPMPNWRYPVGQWFGDLGTYVYTAPFFNKSMFSQIHWYIEVTLTRFLNETGTPSITVISGTTFTLPSRNISIINYKFHYTLDGRLFAVLYTMPPCCSGPWPLGLLGVLLPVSAGVIIAAVAYVLIRKRGQ